MITQELCTCLSHRRVLLCFYLAHLNDFIQGLFSLSDKTSYHETRVGGGGVWVWVWVWVGVGVGVGGEGGGWGVGVGGEGGGGLDPLPPGLNAPTPAQFFLPYPRGWTPTPAQFFLPYPRPLFSLFFFRAFWFFTPTPRPYAPRPCPFFVKSPLPPPHNPRASVPPVLPHSP